MESRRPWNKHCCLYLLLYQMGRPTEMCSMRVSDPFVLTLSLNRSELPRTPDITFQGPGQSMCQGPDPQSWPGLEMFFLTMPRFPLVSWGKAGGFECNPGTPRSYLAVCCGGRLEGACAGPLLEAGAIGQRVDEEHWPSLALFITCASTVLCVSLPQSSELEDSHRKILRGGNPWLQPLTQVASKGDHRRTAR